MNTSQVIIDYLAAAGIRHIFGYPGDPSVEFLEAARRQGMTFVLGSREGTAGLMAEADMRMETGVAAIGVASAVKLCRSIMIKGLEALTVECLFTARRYGVEEQVLASLVETYPGLDWQKEADYLVSRVVQHSRRAAEMREVARTVEEVGMQALLAAPTAQRQDWMADLVSADTVSKSEKSWCKVADAIKAKG